MAIYLLTLLPPLPKLPLYPYLHLQTHHPQFTPSPPLYSFPHNPHPPPPLNHPFPIPSNPLYSSSDFSTAPLIPHQQPPRPTYSVRWALQEALTWVCGEARRGERGRLSKRLWSGNGGRICELCLGLVLQRMVWVNHSNLWPFWLPAYVFLRHVNQLIYFRLWYFTF